LGLGRVPVPKLWIGGSSTFKEVGRKKKSGAFKEVGITKKTRVRTGGPNPSLEDERYPFDKGIAWAGKVPSPKLWIGGSSMGIIRGKNEMWGYDIGV
jgi:hypothetical protein